MCNVSALGVNKWIILALTSLIITNLKRPINFLAVLSTDGMKFDSCDATYDRATYLLIQVGYIKFFGYSCKMGFKLHPSLCGKRVAIFIDSSNSPNYSLTDGESHAR